MYSQDLIIREIHNNVALIHPDGNKFIQDIGEWIKTLGEAILMGLDDHLKEKFKSILKVVCFPITNTDGFPIHTLTNIMRDRLQDLLVEYKIFNPDKPEEVMVAKKMPDILTIIYNRFDKKTGKKLKHDIDFLKKDHTTCNGKAIYTINKVNYILKGVIAHIGDTRKKGHYKYIIWNSENQLWQALPTSTLKAVDTYIKGAHVIMFQTTFQKEDEKEDKQGQVLANKEIMSILEERRLHQFMPPMQQALRLINQSSVCYANAATNVIFSSPHVTSFMATLPQGGGILNIMRSLAQAMPKESQNLQELRRTVDDLVEGKNYSNDYCQQDASEWILSLNDAIKSQLNTALKDHFKSLYNTNLQYTYNCSLHSHKGINQDTFEILPLHVVEKETGNLITTLDKALETFFENYEVEMERNDCGSTVFTKQICIKKLPLVFIMHYLHFSNEGQKLKHYITADTLLK